MLNFNILTIKIFMCVNTNYFKSYSKILFILINELFGIIPPAPDFFYSNPGYE